MRSVGEGSKGTDITRCAEVRGLGAYSASEARTKVEAVEVERRGLTLEYSVSLEDKT